jgi:hypothetical protein
MHANGMLFCVTLQVEGTQSAADAEVIELADDQEKERLAKDPLYRWEGGSHHEGGQQKVHA